MVMHSSGEHFVAWCVSGTGRQTPAGDDKRNRKN
jgi:hypothetical protein